jgi:hypothetical protein
LIDLDVVVDRDSLMAAVALTSAVPLALSVSEQPAFAAV